MSYSYKKSKIGSGLVSKEQFNCLNFLGKCQGARDSMLTSKSELYQLYVSKYRHIDVRTSVKKKPAGQPLRVALCISGFMRNYPYLYQNPTFLEWVSNHRYLTDVYISTWDLVGYGACYDHYLDEHAKIDINDILTTTPNLVKLEVEEYNVVKEQFKQNIPEKHLLLAEEPGVLERFRSQFYKVYKCQQLVNKSGIIYDIVIRLRADLILPAPERFDLSAMYPNIANNCLYVSRDPLYRSDIIGDQIAIGNHYIMNIYCHLYKWLMDETFVKETPVLRLCEKILMYYLKMYNLHIIKMNHRVDINRKRLERLESSKTPINT